MLFCILIWLAVALSQVSPFDAPKTIDFLSNSRQNISFLPYSPAQRELVSLAIENLLQVYINREVKVKKYRHEYGNIDPVPRVKAITKIAAHIDDKRFHYSMVDIFSSLCDFHTQYLIPGVHSCYQAVQPISFAIIQAGNNYNQLIVKSFNQLNTVLELSKNYTANIVPGDRVLRVEGLTFENYVKKYKFNTGGSTDDGSMRAALIYMSTRNGQTMKMPNTDFVHYLIKSKRTGKVYPIDLPWITISLDKCVNDSKNLTIRNEINTQKVHIAENMNMIAFQQSFATKSLVNVQRTEEPILTWMIYDPNGRNLGVIFLESFSPRGNDSLKIINLIRSLLLNQLKNTNSLVFDVRDNVGGAIEMADLLPQLFGMNISTITGRVLQTSINQKLFQNVFSPSDPWSIAYNDTSSNNSYSKNVVFTDNSVANSFGQAYIKPVGVFTNARCYSACEIFAANMKDNNISVIFGEDRNTGGGGANVVTYNEFLSKYATDKFPSLPYSKFPGVSSNLRVAWRQTIRPLNNNSLIEENGVKSDYVLKPKEIDVLLDSEVDSRYDYIADKLNKISTDTGRDKIFLGITPINAVDFKLNFPVEVNFETKGISSIQVFDQAGRKILDRNVIGNIEENISINANISKAGYNNFKFKAFDYQANLVFETYRKYRFIPSSYLVYDPISRENQILEYVADYVAQFDDPEKSDQGWTRSMTNLTLGFKPYYSNNISSKLSWFVDAGEYDQINVKVKLTYQTEFGSDILSFGYTNSYGYTQQLLYSFDQNGVQLNGVSGIGRIDQVFQLNFLDGLTEIFLLFTSDDSLTKSGILVEEILIF